MLPNPLIVQVLDAAGQPVQGAEVAFSLDGVPGGSVSPATVQTDAEGEAGTQVRLGTTSGPQSVSARAVGGPADAVVSFRLVALAPDEGGDDGDNGDGGDSGPGGGGGGGGHQDDDDDDDDDYEGD